MVSSLQNIKNIKKRIDASEARASRQMRAEIGEAMMGEVQEYAHDLLEDVELVHSINSLTHQKRELEAKLRALQSKQRNTDEKDTSQIDTNIREVEAEMHEVDQTISDARRLKSSITKKKQSLRTLYNHVEGLRREVKRALNIGNFL
jgi:chromosome segregation ATPase